LTEATISGDDDRPRYPYCVQAVTRPAPTRPAARAPRELLERTGYLFARLGYNLKARSIDEFERAGLSPYYYSVLALLDQGACRSQASMAESLKLDRSQVVGLLDKLEELELVERRRDQHDRRRHVVTLTPAGRRALARCRAIMTRLEAEFLEPLDEDDRVALHQLLLRLAGHHDPRFRPTEEAA
jgi:MarR family transcriptional regulator, lower aerobic nicotinate degradation pathway regulator